MHEKQLTIIYEDNGKGFEQQSNTKGIGLKNIEERIISIKGNYTIESFTNSGFVFILNIPKFKSLTYETY